MQYLVDIFIIYNITAKSNKIKKLNLLVATTTMELLFGLPPHHIYRVRQGRTHKYCTWCPFRAPFVYVYIYVYIVRKIIDPL